MLLHLVKPLSAIFIRISLVLSSTLCEPLLW
jgi:hypothetical protein